MIFEHCFLRLLRASAGTLLPRIWGYVRTHWYPHALLLLLLLLTTALEPTVTMSSINDLFDMTASV